MEDNSLIADGTKPRTITGTLGGNMDDESIDPNDVDLLLDAFETLCRDDDRHNFGVDIDGLVRWHLGVDDLEEAQGQFDAYVRLKRAVNHIDVSAD